MGSEIVVIPALFLGLPWIIMHYITKWKTAATLTNDDEKMLSEMYELARRLEDRLDTVERLVSSDNPDFTPRRIDRDAEDYVSENVRRLERNR
ncbi:MAG: envelope stress response membrane protein PspB [Sphingorhabdus sp.]